MLSGLVQTGLLLAAPYLLPKAIRLGQAFLNPQPKGQRQALHPTHGRTGAQVRVDSPRLAAFRLFVVTLGISLAVFSALSPPHNLFLSLAAPHSTLSRLLPFLRRPLDIRLATETLARAWSHSLRRPLTDSELAVASRLQTLDARLVYVAYGAGPLMQCAWCRPPGSSNTEVFGVLGADYLVALVPPTVIAYLAGLAGAGLLLTGNGRERWRLWMTLLVLAAMGAEAWSRLIWDAGRGGTLIMASRASIPEISIHSQIHVLRSAFFAVLLALAYLAPDASIPLAGPGTSTIVGPALAAVSRQTESILHRLRALSMLRMAVLHHDEFRPQVNDFWTSASRESKLARSDATVRTALETKLRGANGPSETFSAWLEDVMRGPEVADGQRRSGARREGETAAGAEEEDSAEAAGSDEDDHP